MFKGVVFMDAEDTLDLPLTTTTKKGLTRLLIFIKNYDIHD